MGHGLSVQSTQTLLVVQYRCQESAIAENEPLVMKVLLNPLSKLTRIDFHLWGSGDQLVIEEPRLPEHRPFPPV